jgi:glycosyltransferase involved in cell wall biosynthesis
MSNTGSPRLALFLYSLDGGGAERVMVNLANAFVRIGISVDFILVRAQGPYLNELAPEIRVCALKATQTLIALPELINYLRREKPLAILSAMHYANEIALLAKRFARSSARLVVCEHSILSRYAVSTRRKERYTPVAARLLYPWANTVVAVSKGVASDLKCVTGLGDSQIRVIYNPIFTPQLLEQAQEPVDHPWFAPGEPPVILGVGRLVGVKDFPTLIRAFAKVRQVRTARLMILGSNGDSYEMLEALVHSLGLTEDVAMLGFVANPAAYLARSAVFATASKLEGFGNVIVEALAVGTPVVSTDCESGPAEILARGKYGRLVPVGDVQAMAVAILNVLSLPPPSVDVEWLKQFSLDFVSQQYLDILGI